MSELGKDLIQAMNEALTHAKGKGPAVVHISNQASFDGWRQSILTSGKTADNLYQQILRDSPAFVKDKPDGGPSGYYDLPPSPKTLNDLLEYKADKHWLGDSFHLSNIVKAAWRWGIKSGTDKAYDARKFVYSGVRLLLKYRGQQEVRRYLQELLDDPQFGGCTRHE